MFAFTLSSLWLRERHELLSLKHLLLQNLRGLQHIEDVVERHDCQVDQHARDLGCVFWVRYVSVDHWEEDLSEDVPLLAFG